MRRLNIAAALAALVGLAGAGVIPAKAGIMTAQYGGPMMGDPDGPPGSGPPGYGPGMGPFMGPPGAGGPVYGGPRGGRRSGPFRTYHGFRIDLGEARGAVDVPGALRAVEHQIDIVERVGLGRAMLAEFRAVPIRLSTRDVGGSNYRGGGVVTLGEIGEGDDRPILLNEYMHVVQYRNIPGGFRSPVLRRFYDEALAGGLYPPNAFLMTNPIEFFGVTASCYLNGTIAREPFSRAAIRERQPDYYAFLSRLFGPRGDAAGVRGSGEVATR